MCLSKQTERVSCTSLAAQRRYSHFICTFFPVTRSNAKCLKSSTVVELLLVFDELPVIVHVVVLLALLLLHNIHIICVPLDFKSHAIA